MPIQQTFDMKKNILKKGERERERGGDEILKLNFFKRRYKNRYENSKLHRNQWETKISKIENEELKTIFISSFLLSLFTA